MTPPRYYFLNHLFTYPERPRDPEDHWCGFGSAFRNPLDRPTAATHLFCESRHRERRAEFAGTEQIPNGSPYEHFELPQRHPSEASKS